MNTIIEEIKITGSKPVTLIPMSDTHVGHADHDRELFQKTINWIKKHNAYVILLGDLIDGIIQRDKRFENNSIAPEFRDHLDNLHYKQTETFIDMVRPIKKQIIGIMGGNHEITVKKAFSYDAISVMAKELNIPILTDPSYVILRFRDNNSTMLYTIFCSHGCWMGGRKRGSKINSMEDKMADFDFDMICAGHTHDKWVSTRKRIGVSKNGLLQGNRRIFINTGSFLRTYKGGDYDGWAARSVFSPQSAGVVRVDFYLKRNDKDARYIDCHTRI